ncbi:alkaline phosphatase D family protein [Planobispora siamensis]|uniref:Phosphodiesterase/alkaline phosphatase D n=1 Tax=Planobispora siamensis TaxID=936338 RepID=A0A8J3SVI5_9ACTN|nr:alkaline phosphatase D family protein [Planobispora siamensis]GIH96328.1 hypothetical protein Psi01_69580 [Planobispora siamensis]
MTVQPDLQIFVPAIMSAGLLFSIAAVLRDVLRSARGRAPGLDRRLDVAGHATARHVITGEPPGAALGQALRRPLFYRLTAMTGLGLCVYLVVGATYNYFHTDGYLRGIAWMWAVSLLPAAVAGLAGTASAAILRAWPTPPRWAAGLVVATPLGRDPGGAPEDSRRMLIGWAAVWAAAATGILALILQGSPHIAAAVDDIAAPVSGWTWLTAPPLGLYGAAGTSLVLALAVGVATLRCLVFALAYPAATAVGLAATLVLRSSAEHSWPADTFPSGHVAQAALMAGLLPVALTVLTRRAWPARALAVPLAAAAVLVALSRLQTGANQGTDVLAGALLGGALALGGRWALRHPGWHVRCHGCPWSSPASARESGLFDLHPVTRRVIRRAARAWAAAVVAGFAVLSLTVGVPRDPEGDGLVAMVEEPLQLALLVIAALGWLVAWRREGAGAVLLALAGVGLGSTAALTYPPLVSVLVTVVFLAPAVAFWLLWQHTRSRRDIAVLAAVTALLIGTVWTGGALAYDHYFGPAHPESATPALRADRVSWVWSGAITPSSFRVTARLTGPAEQAGLIVRPSPQIPPAPVAVPDSRVVTWTVTGLRPGTRHTYTVVVDGHPDGTRGRGSMRTSPEGAGSFTVAASACARTGSDGAVYDAIRRSDPLLYLITGDLHYGNVEEDDVAAFRARYDETLTAPAQAALYRSTPVAYVWDDHDYGPNEADAASPSRRAARLAYRENTPHYPLPSEAVYQAFTVGRVRFVLTDTRSERTGASMLGPAQLAWLEDELVRAGRTHALVVWVNPDPWIVRSGPGADGWGAYPAERRRLATTIERNGVDNLVMISGDAHMLALDDGSHSGYGPARKGFPVLQAAPLDRPGAPKGGPYSEGMWTGAGQYGTLTVHDDGSRTLAVDLAGHDWTGRTLFSRTFRFDHR